MEFLIGLIFLMCLINLFFTFCLMHDVINLHVKLNDILYLVSNNKE